MKNTKDVDEFMAELNHPLKAEIEAVRAIILGSNEGITELVKWNAPSFHFRGDFLTFNLRPTDSVQLVFHRGAKVKDNTTNGSEISDPSGLLKWIAKERCLATFSSMQDIRSKEAALVDIVRQWIAQM